MTTTATTRRAVRALGDEDRSLTGRVFAAARAAEGTETTVQTAMETYATWRARYRFELPPDAVRTVRQLCAAARDQGYEVDAAAAIEAAVPTDCSAVLARARGIRQAQALGPREREQRLDTLLEDADAAGLEVDRHDIDTGRCSESGADSLGLQSSNHGPSEGVSSTGQHQGSDDDPGDDGRRSSSKGASSRQQLDSLPEAPTAMTDLLCAVGRTDVHLGEHEAESP